MAVLLVVKSLARARINPLMYDDAGVEVIEFFDDLDELAVDVSIVICEVPSEDQEEISRAIDWINGVVCSHFNITRKPIWL